MQRRKSRSRFGSTEKLKRIAVLGIEKHRREIIELSHAILQDPETGFKEFRTARLVEQKLKAFGVRYQSGLALTGVKGRIQGGAPGPSIALLGEMDAVRVAGHPHANQQTNAAHACGHHAQIGIMLGATIGLLADGVMENISGTVVPFAVPAEEFIEVEDRLQLQREGQLEFLSGKQELIRLGAFDDVDLAMLVHATSQSGDRSIAVGGTNNGHVVKYVQFLGRSAHAGGAPHLGVNALNAANLALHAIHALRETFVPEDNIRVHGIITKGGEVVNAVPADVRFEGRVRGASIEAIERVSSAVDRCLRAGALGVGGTVRIQNIAGYLPLIQNPMLQALFLANAQDIVGVDQTSIHPPLRRSGGSTDMGDLSHLMPVIQPYAGGVTGSGHGSDFVVQDYEAAVITPAKVMALTVIDLLANEAAKAYEVLGHYLPLFTTQQYLSLQRSRNIEKTYDETQ